MTPVATLMMPSTKVTDVYKLKTRKPVVYQRWSLQAES